VIVCVVVLIQRSDGSSVELDRPHDLGNRPAGLAQPVGPVTRIKVRDRRVDNRMAGEGVERQRTPRDRAGLESRPTAVVSHAKISIAPRVCRVP
jgi:hypothetical protein